MRLGHMTDAHQDHNLTNEPYTPADRSVPSTDEIDPTDVQFDPTWLDDMDYIAAHLASFGFAQGDTRRLHHLTANNMHFAHLEYYTMLAHASDSGMNISDTGANTTFVGRSCNSCFMD